MLQDQHFDLQHLREQADATPNADPDALDAIVEGDAVRIQDDYLAQLSDAEKQQYDQQNGAELDRYDQASGSLPEIFNLQMGAPYLYGPYTIRVRLADDGNAADRPGTERPSALDPHVRRAGQHRSRGAGESEIQSRPAPRPSGEFSRFNAFDLFVMLGACVDAYVALRAADLVAGGRVADVSPNRRQGVCADDDRGRSGQGRAGFMRCAQRVGGGNAWRHSRRRRTVSSRSRHVIPVPRRRHLRPRRSRPPNNCSRCAAS